MTYLIAAVNQTTSGQEAAGGFWTRLPDHWPAQTDLISWWQNMGTGIGVVLVLAGIAYLVYGFRWYKVLVTANAAALGGAVGCVLGHKLGSAAAGAILGLVLAAAVTLPTMKYAVAVMGGLFGGVVGATIWRISTLDPAYAWAGALAGLILFGLLAFIIFRGSIIMYMSLQGGVMLVFGVLGLLYGYQDVAAPISQNIQLKPFLLPMVIFVVALAGHVYQQTHTAAAGKE